MLAAEVALFSRLASFAEMSCRSMYRGCSRAMLCNEPDVVVKLDRGIERPTAVASR
jgi:hypothetical protein